jgi:hypothetical protein
MIAIFSSVLSPLELPTFLPLELPLLELELVVKRSDVAN